MGRGKAFATGDNFYVGCKRAGNLEEELHHHAEDLGGRLEYVTTGRAATRCRHSNGRRISGNSTATGRQPTARWVGKKGLTGRDGQRDGRDGLFTGHGMVI
jgi:hypothetical protein